MGAQDNTDNVLRQIHVLLSKSDAYPNEQGKIIIDKRQMLNLLTELNRCIAQMMKEYELTRQSRDQAERLARKKNQEMAKEAQKKAEDVYAASVMYTNEALGQIREIIKNTEDSMEDLYKTMAEHMQEQERSVRDNQLELRSQLQDLVDADMYTQIIEDRNRDRQREKEKLKIQLESKGENGRLYSDRVRAVQINHDIVERLRSERIGEENPTPFDQARDDLLVRKKSAEEADRERYQEETEADLDEDLSIVDLDAEYFQWKDTKK